MSKQLESIKFLSCLREAIDLSIDPMELEESVKTELSNFIISEASDYEILHFSMTGKFPKEKYNSVNEAELISSVKNCLVENYMELIENGNYTEESLDELIESLVPLSEYGLSSSKLIIEHLSSTGVLPIILNEKWWFKKKQKPADAWDAATDPAAENISTKNPIHIMGKKGSPAGSDIPPEISSAHNAAVDPTDVKSAAEGSRLLGKLGKATGVTVAIAALLYGGYKTYQRFLSKAARACASKSGAEKTACMEAFKKNAIKAQISDLKRGLSGCKNSKNPQKCQSAINAKIQKLQAKL